MINEFHNKYFGINLILDDEFNFSCKLHCFGDYNTTLTFSTEDYNIEDIDSIDELNKITDSFFKASYDNFLWLRTDRSNLYSLLAEESYFQEYNYNISISQHDLDNEVYSRVSSLKIHQITFYPNKHFKIDFYIRDLLCATTFNKDKKTEY